MKSNSDNVIDQFTGYCSTPLLLLLQPSAAGVSTSDVNAQILPFKAYEPTIEIRDRKSRSVYIEVPFNVETGEAERIAVDWTARGGGRGTSCK
jgi:COP9 signalosome complex subunit 6